MCVASYFDQKLDMGDLRDVCSRTLPFAFHNNKKMFKLGREHTGATGHLGEMIEFGLFDEAL